MRATSTLPTPLREICLDLERQRPIESNLEELKNIWETNLAKIMAVIPGICIESDGETVHLHGLSPGCAACKAGTWDCIFITSRCNLNCAFCYSPLNVPEGSPASVFGPTPQEITQNHARTHITGVSFSGGEPFLEPHKLMEWVDWFKKHRPDQYTWVYTNGLLAETSLLKELGRLGLDEIRFDTAATGYTHPTVLRNMAAAAESIPNVTVEIPAIPTDAERLFVSWPILCNCGVRYLNLHELIYEPGSLSWEMPGNRLEAILPDGHRTCVHPGSRSLTLAVIKRVAEENLPLAVNDCSLQSKLLQMRGRRRSLAPLNRGTHEKLVGDVSFESYCIFRDESDYQFVHPDHLPQFRRLHPDWKVVRLVREAPLSLNGPKRWISLEEC
jgi:pyruvate formate-lyase activating enzyme-like uncharacterized protein